VFCSKLVLIYYQFTVDHSVHSPAFLYCLLYCDCIDWHGLLPSLAIFFTDYCKTLNFSCILIWRFWIVEFSLHFNLAFSQGVLCNVKFQVTLAMRIELCITILTRR